MPVIDRETIQNHRSALASTKKSEDFQRVTGGSTAEPVQIPAWSSERKYEQRDFWYARNWYDVTPADRLFLLWGHSHIFGEGLSGWWNRVKRRLKDRLLGYHRANAYDLSDDALRRAGNELLRTPPDYLLGYSKALDQFAQVNKDRKDEFHRLDLKVVIATAEAFPRSDSSEVIENVFGAPVAMEYGAVETGPMAYQTPDGDFQIFWRHYKIEGEKTNLLDGAYEIYVTSLYPRCFPLVRYRIGDMVPENPNADTFDQMLPSIIGRCNDYIVLPDGQRIHSVALIHAVQDVDGIQALQIHQKDEEEITVYYESESGGPLSDQRIDIMREGLSRLDARMRDVEIQVVSSLEQSPAGKQKRVVREQS
jgi:phenylacetate-coenzyme A ligase PaaK-like adenylate-forming protein